jgi:hypothetical protein
MNAGQKICGGAESINERTVGTLCAELANSEQRSIASRAFLRCSSFLVPLYRFMALTALTSRFRLSASHSRCRGGKVAGSISNITIGGGDDVDCMWG